MLTLIIGNKNYSSWSLRPWLVLRHSGIAFQEVRIPLYQDTSKATILRYSPSGKVPALIDADLTLWESLAICEYLAERFPDAKLWPQDPAARALARAVSTEMHAGFASLRQHLTMNCRKRCPPRDLPPAVQQDIGRIFAIWQACRARNPDGPMLFGQFSIADAMFAPVAFRLAGYSVAMSPEDARYVHMLLNLPAMQEWAAAASAEEEVLTQFERDF